MAALPCWEFSRQKTCSAYQGCIFRLRRGSLTGLMEYRNRPVRGRHSGKRSASQRFVCEERDHDVDQRAQPAARQASGGMHDPDLLGVSMPLPELHETPLGEIAFGERPGQEGGPSAGEHGIPDGEGG